MANYAIPDTTTQQKMNEIFKILFENECLIPFEDNDKFDKIWERTNSIMKISEAKYTILEDEELLRKYKLFWAGHFINDFDIYNDYFHQAASYLLGMFEHTKRFLLMVLDKQKLGISDRSTYGSIVIRIAQKCNLNEDELKELFDLETRNVIGHDDWYYSDKHFTYVDDGCEKKISITEFVEKIRYATALSSAIAIAWNKYFLMLELGSKLKPKF